MSKNLNRPMQDESTLESGEEEEEVEELNKRKFSNYKNNANGMIKSYKKNSKYQIAGYLQQIRILLWKNYIQSRRNLFGIFFECLCPAILMLILLIIRFSVPMQYYSDEKTNETGIIDRFKYENQTNLVLYYPNNAFIKDIVQEAIEFIKMRKVGFNPIRK